MKKGLLPLLLLISCATFAQKTIRTLPQKGSAALTDTIPVQNGTTQALQLQKIYDLFGVAGSYTSITGINDSTFTLNRTNGTKDTIVIAGAGGAASSDTTTLNVHTNGYNDLRYGSLTQQNSNTTALALKLNITDTATLLHKNDSTIANRVTANTLALAGKLTAGNNLNDLNNVTTARTNLGLGTMALRDSAEYIKRTTAYGTLYNKNSWSGLTDFTNNGATVSVSSNKLAFSAGANTYTQSLDYNYYTCLSRWKITDTVVVTEKSAASFGNGVGIRSYSNGQQYTVLAAFDASTGGNSGKVSVIATGATLATSTAITWSVNDSIVISCERRMDTLFATAFNLTTKTSYTSTFFVFASSFPVSNFMHNTGKFAVFSVGGTFTVTGMGIRSAEPKYAEVMCVGDSKTAGYAASAFNLSYPMLLKKTYPSLIVNAGPSDRTPDVVNRIPEIIALAPQQVVLCIGFNDKANGVADATWQGNISTAVTQLQAAGIRVILINSIYDTYSSGTVGAAVAGYINSSYPSTQVIDAYNAGKAVPAVVQTDLIHPTDLGMQVVADAVVNSNLLTGANPAGSNYITQQADAVLSSLNVIRNGTGGTVAWVKNLTAGTGNYAQIKASADATTLSFNVSSSTFTTSGANVANGVNMDASGAGGLSLTASSGSGTIKFITGANATANERFRITSAGGFTIPQTNTASGTTGAQTINKVVGSVNLAAGATSLVVTNSLVTASSHIWTQIETNDANAFSVRVVPAAGSFTIFIVGTAPAAETKVGFLVVN